MFGSRTGFQSSVDQTDREGKSVSACLVEFEIRDTFKMLLEEGDLKGLEEKIYQGIFKIGRKLMECGMRKGQESEPVPTKTQGECGHQQKLVGYRSKKLLTLKGSVEWKRADYQCQQAKSRKDIERLSIE